MHAPWTAGSILPGGEFRDHASFLTYLKESYPWAPEAMLQRFVRSYGTLARSILGNAQSVSDLGKHFGADLYQAEVDYLIEQEWAVQAEDILWRRSKLGLALDSSQQAALRDYLSGDGKASHLFLKSKIFQFGCAKHYFCCDIQIRNLIGLGYKRSCS